MYILEQHFCHMIFSLLDLLIRPLFQNSNNFIAAIYAIDANTAPNDPSLWNVVIPKMKSNIMTLTNAPGFLKMVTVDIPDLAVVLFQSLDQSTTAVFRSTRVLLAPAALPSSVDNKASGTNEHGDGGDDDGEDDEMDVGMGMGPGGRAAPKRRGGPYRGQGRRLG